LIVLYVARPRTVAAAVLAVLLAALHFLGDLCR